MTKSVRLDRSEETYRTRLDQALAAIDASIEAQVIDREALRNRHNAVLDALDSGDIELMETVRRTLYGDRLTGPTT